ncbi:LuxR C-terminal-related transcriptional regulator [Cohnella cellulosilytica]|uniref:LuxR C-terminal-related transcriptional regulator n=1 Tax=Cohnella cellulosilytica TaxID=986710 RepID=A0ABW2F6Y4_9BACL
MIERLNGGQQRHRKLTLISAAAGFGKTTLAAQWLGECSRPAAWLSLDEGDNDPARFLAYFVAALRTVAPNAGEGALGVLLAPQLPPIEAIMTPLINELAEIEPPFILILDDYHVIENELIDRAMIFLLERLPSRMHLVIVARKDPGFSLAKLRARDQLTELRAADLRFTAAEAGGFLHRTMGLELSPDNAAALEARTEGWAAGLQLAAISMRDRQDVDGFVRTFNGTHPYVVDYLIEEVLRRQPDSVKSFLLQTSVLERMCGPLCDAVLDVKGDEPDGQTMLQELERANLFIVPLDDERRWYRYHHLFADLLRRRQQGPDAAELRVRASVWHENNGDELEAFRYAAAAGDIDRAARLIEGSGMPLLFRGAAMPVLEWLNSLPKRELNTRPSLLVLHASALLFVGRMADVEPRLQAAEAAIAGATPDERGRDLIGHIASIRATLAVARHQADEIAKQSRRALAYLHPDNLPVRTATTWALGYACHLRGERAAAGRAYAEALAVSDRIGHYIVGVMSAIGLGNIQETDNRLELAETSYRDVLRRVGDAPLPAVCEAHLGLARIGYERNDLEAARQHGQESARFAPLLESTDRALACELFLARLRRAEGDRGGAAAAAARAELLARQHGFAHRLPEIAAVQAELLLSEGDAEAAAERVRPYELPLSQARICLAQGEWSAALDLLETLGERAKEENREDERLRATILEALARQAAGDGKQALNRLRDALALAEPGGFVRIFVDEGEPMRRLLIEAHSRGIKRGYIAKLLGAFRSALPAAQALIEPLSERELEVLRLVEQGFSNQEIGERLFLALSSVKGHNRNIFDKLHVRRRTEAVARARELGLL